MKTKVPRYKPSFFPLLAIVLGMAGAARADIIYLKNGRQIQATNTARKDGKVTFETAAGTMALSEALVDKIVKDDSGLPSQASANSGAAELSMAPPTPTGAGAPPALSSIVRNGAIDQDALAQIDARASSGSADAMARAAEAEAAASQFELGRNNLGAAVQHAERSLTFAPGQPALLINAAYLRLRRNEYGPALDLLERARRSDPDSAQISKLAGWADYGLNRLPDAVAEWQRSQELHPDPEVLKALEKAKRDLDVENSFREGRSAHFDLHYYGEAAPALAHDVLRVLESDFDEISGAVNYAPSQPISVTLYTNETFRDITHAPSWVGALNDGRIRVPVQGLDSVTPDLARILKHELTHSFITEKTHGRCPTWLQEGAAQWMEGTRTGTGAAAGLLALYDRHLDPSLTILEPLWVNLPAGFASVAYQWSLAVVETIEATSPGDLVRILARMDEGASNENAVRMTLHQSYAELNTATADYIRKIR
jgi:tetratricopeptide (TPR) repeat protein